MLQTRLIGQLIVTTLIVLCSSISSGTHAGELEAETLRLVERLRFKGSDADFAFPPSSQEVSKICWRLGSIGPEARDAVPTLIDLLTNNQNSLAATVALERIGGEAVPALREAVSESSGEAQLLVIETLGRIGPDATAAIPDLVDLLHSNSYDVRHACFRAIGGIRRPSERTLATLSELLDHEHEATRVMAARTLGNLSEAEKALPGLIDSTTDDSPDVRLAALRSIVRLDSTSRRAVPILVRALDDYGVAGSGGFGTRMISSEAAWELRLMGKEASLAVPALIQMFESGVFDDAKPVQLTNIVEVLATNHTISHQAEHHLRRLLKQFDDAVRRQGVSHVALCVAAADALLRIDRADREARDVLVKVLNDNRWKTGRVDSGKGLSGFPDPRPEAAEAVGHLGEDARDFMPVLKRLLNEGMEREHQRLAANAGWALASIDLDDQSCVPGLIMCIERFPLVHSESPAEIARVLKPRIKTCLPALLNKMFAAASDYRTGPQKVLLRVLIELGDVPISRVIERAVTVTEADDPATEWGRTWRVEHAEFNVVPLLGSKAELAVPQLVENLRSESHFVRARSAEILGQLKSSADRVVPELIELQNDKRTLCRASAATALGRFGSDARSAAPALQAAERDEYRTVQRAAHEALLRIQ